MATEATAKSRSSEHKTKVTSEVSSVPRAGSRNCSTSRSLTSVASAVLGPPAYHPVDESKSLSILVGPPADHPVDESKSLSILVGPPGYHPVDESKSLAILAEGAVSLVPSNEIKIFYFVAVVALVIISSIAGFMLDM
eukprot:g9017.t1